MGVITGYTAERMLEIEQSTVVDAEVVGDELILEKRDGTTINAGNIKGPQGDPGPLGGIGEAPVNGVAHTRKDADWEPFSPVNEAPIDGKDYGRKDGDWEPVAGPWKLEFNYASAQRPAGFLLEAGLSAREWFVSFAGSGYTVDYHFRFGIMGSDVNATAHLTLPASLLPIVPADTNAFAYDWTGMHRVGNVSARINTDGTVNLPRIRNLLLAGLPEDIDGDGKVMEYDSIYTIGIQMSGTFIRNTMALPNLATYV